MSRAGRTYSLAVVSGDKIGESSMDIAVWLDHNGRQSGIGTLYGEPRLISTDIQYHFLPLVVSYDGHKLATEQSFQAHVGPLRSKSTGSVTLRSADARDKPAIRFNYMSHEDDWEEMRACVRLTREIFAPSAFDDYRGREIQPGANVTGDADIDAFIRERAESAYHPSCTCRMGRADDPAAVVDPQTRVIGVEGLRVVDASIMPSITSGNLNAPTIMIGERAADAILGKPPLPPSNVPVYVAAVGRRGSGKDQAGSHPPSTAHWRI